MERTKFYACDTETRLLFDGKPTTDDFAYKFIKEHTTPEKSGIGDFKQHFEVQCYALQISNGKEFKLCQSIEEFLQFCCEEKISLCVWYNAKFDFAIFTDWLLRNNWKIKDEKGKATENCYTDLVGDMGQRYCLTLYYTYRGRGKHHDHAKHTHKIRMIDLCNVVGGGLAKNLEDWQITYPDGIPIRKLKMQYDNASIDNADDLAYMRVDVDGLYYLTQKVDETLKSLTGLSFVDGDYMTVGGMAKKAMLREMYQSADDKENVKRFKLAYPMTLKMDKFCRDGHLYEGGLSKPNEFKRGMLIRNDYVYDVNSMYPDKMRNALMPCGIPSKTDKIINDDKHITIVHITRIWGVLKSDKVAIYRDTTIKDFVTYIDDRNRLMWFDELEELKKWYDLDFEFDYCFVFQARRDEGMARFVDKFYNLKAQSKGCVREACKKPLNSSYGKIAQRAERPKQHYELSESNAIHIVSDGIETSEKSLMSIFVGSRITSCARVHLMQLIRDICHENVREYFNYCDTDSVHATLPYDKADAKTLGKAKLELKARYVLYIAPKTYLLKKDNGDYVVHCKGVNTSVVEEALKGKSILQAIDIFTANVTFKTLCGLNVKGGKALVYMDKMILREDNYKNQVPDNLDVDEGLI